MVEAMTEAEAITALQSLLQNSKQMGEAVSIPVAQDPIAENLPAINAALGLDAAAAITGRKIGKDIWYDRKQIEGHARLTLEEAKRGDHIGAQPINAGEAGEIFVILEREDTNVLPRSTLEGILRKGANFKLNNKDIFLREPSGAPGDPDYRIDIDALLAIIDSPITSREASLLMSSRAGNSATKALSVAARFMDRDDAKFICSDIQLKVLGPAWNRRLDASGLPHTSEFNEEREQTQVSIPYRPLFDIAEPALRARAEQEAGIL